MRQNSRENIKKQVQMPGLICAPHTPTRTHTELLVGACVRVCVDECNTWFCVFHTHCFHPTLHTFLAPLIALIMRFFLDSDSCSTTTTTTFFCQYFLFHRVRNYMDRSTAVDLLPTTRCLRCAFCVVRQCRATSAE